MEILKNDSFLLAKNISSKTNDGQGHIIDSEHFVMFHNFLKKQLNPTLAMQTENKAQGILVIKDGDLHLSFYRCNEKCEKSLLEIDSVTNLTQSKTRESLTKAMNNYEKIKSQIHENPTMIEKHSWQPLEKKWITTANCLLELVDLNLRDNIFTSEIVNRIESNPEFLDPIEIRNPRNLTIQGTIISSNKENTSSVIQHGNKRTTFSHEERPEIGVLISKIAPGTLVNLLLRENYDVTGLSHHNSRFTAISLQILVDPRQNQVDIFLPEESVHIELQKNMRYFSVYLYSKLYQHIDEKILYDHNHTRLSSGEFSIKNLGHFWTQINR